MVDRKAARWDDQMAAPTAVRRVDETAVGKAAQTVVPSVASTAALSADAMVEQLAGSMAD
jgi:hypothetical protein